MSMDMLQVCIPQGGGWRQGRGGQEEGAAAEDLWTLDGHGDGPDQGHARGGCAAQRHLRPPAGVQVPMQFSELVTNSACNALHSRWTEAFLLVWVWGCD